MILDGSPIDEVTGSAVSRAQESLRNLAEAGKVELGANVLSGSRK